MTVEVNLCNDEGELFNKYSADEENKKIPLLTMQSVVTTVLNDLEDLKAYIKAMEEFEKDPVTYSHEEFWKMLEDE